MRLGLEHHDISFLVGRMGTIETSRKPRCRVTTSKPAIKRPPTRFTPSRTREHKQQRAFQRWPISSIPERSGTLRKSALATVGIVWKSGLEEAASQRGSATGSAATGTCLRQT